MSDPDRIKILARVELQRTDWKLARALERSMASPEWCDWRDAMRDIASHPEGHEEPLPPEPAFGSPAIRLEPAYDPPAELDPSSDLLQELDALKDENAELKAELERLRNVPAPEPHNFPENMSDKLVDWDTEANFTTDELDPEEHDRIVNGLIDVLKSGKPAAEDAFRQLSSDDRVRLFPLLNAELSRLNNQEALLGRSIPRKADVESLIGILARVGEA